MPLLRDEEPRSKGDRTDFFDAPTNPMRVLNEAWQALAEKSLRLRFVGYAWDAILVLLLISAIRTVLTDPYGFGSSFQGVFFTLGGFVLVALLLWHFVRPVGRGAMLQVAALVRFIGKMLPRIFGSRKPDQ